MRKKALLAWPPEIPDLASKAPWISFEICSVNIFSLRASTERKLGLTLGSVISSKFYMVLVILEYYC